MTQLAHAVDEVEPTGEVIPLLQLEQDVMPLTDEKVPSAQMVQAA
jgi:hypothetical protein